MWGIIPQFHDEMLADRKAFLYRWKTYFNTPTFHKCNDGFGYATFDGIRVEQKLHKK
jgi:hypothetical protein